MNLLQDPSKLPEGDGVKLQVDSRDDDFSDSESESDPSESSSSSSESEEFLPDSPPRRRRSRSKGRSRATKRSRRDYSEVRSKSSRVERDQNQVQSEFYHDNAELMKLVDELVNKKLAEKEKGKKITTPIKDHQARPQSVKSPSDTAVYVPALQRIARRDVDVPQSPQGESDILEKLKAIRLQTMSNIGISGESSTPAEPAKPDHEKTPREVAREQADEAILEAEQYKAAATALPAGKPLALVPYDYNLDGQFLQASCHVEPTLIEKIKLGQFVELEKLLNRIIQGQKKAQESKVEIINTQGETFSLTTNAPDKECKITNVRKWERAFRVYAMIYST